MPQTAFLFPGQGAQTLGMGRELCHTLPEARRLFDEASEVLGYDLADVCRNGPLDRLNSTAISQPALYVSSLAALEALRQKEPETVQACTAAAGLSLGEYTALTFAGTLSFRDGLSVVRRRGEAMQAAAEANPGAMVCVLMMEREQVEELCKQVRGGGTLELANFLCPGNIAVSGSKAACEALERLVAEKGGGKAVRLPVAGAFHTNLMRPADEGVADALTRALIRPARLPVYSNVDARPHTDPVEIIQLLVQQVLSPVLWEQTIRNLIEAGVEQFYEIGPGTVLAGLLKRVNRKFPCQGVPA